EVPPTSDPSWAPVWRAWDETPAAYWWHDTRQARNRDLPPKKTRQLTYALYTLLESDPDGDWLLDYIDADSVPPPDHFLAGAIGMRTFDVLQSTNIAGNLLDTWAASWHAMDHMSWDGNRYPHLSANGRHPYWVLGKGLFYWASDLVEVGGFNPWLAIEDPEIGMRLWANGKRLGIIEAPLIEEVPRTIRGGITQRKRWVCGFFQSLTAPTKAIGLRFGERVRAWVNFLPCLLLAVNPIGIPVGVWALVESVEHHGYLPSVLLGLGAFNVATWLASMTLIYVATWRRTKIVLERRRDRVRYILRVNPLAMLVFWLIWVIPLVLGFQMYLRDKGLVWERTEKVDANHDLVLALNEQAVMARLSSGAAAAPAFERVLITGGAGFIGSDVADELLARGDAVRALDNLTAQVHGESKRPDYLAADVELQVGDVRDPEAVGRALDGVDSVVHLAARVGVGQSMYEIANYTLANSGGTAVLLEALLDHPVRRLVVASSMSIYGDGAYRNESGE